MVDGMSVGAVSRYTFRNVTANHTISASFTIKTYTITASAGSHGSISPSGKVTVTYGANQTFTITANTSYHISNVNVDGVSVGAVTSYTFSDVTANHKIRATFAPDVPAPTVTRIAPSSGLRNTSVTVTISGSNFTPGATVILLRGGKVINASSVTVLSNSLIICTFNLKNAELGKYDVVVKNPDGQEGRLITAFNVRSR
jgi:hypothetical protein